MSVSQVCAHLGKVGSVVFKNSNHFMGSVVISKPMSYSIYKPIRNIWAFDYDVKDNKSKNGELPHFARIHVNSYRFCTTNAQNPIPSSPDQPPTPPSIPSKKQMERAFFRSVAFFWDNGGNFFAWSRDMFKTHVIESPSVQFYWKRFNDKMEEAKKNEF